MDSSLARLKISAAGDQSGDYGPRRKVRLKYTLASFPLVPFFHNHRMCVTYTLILFVPRNKKFRARTPDRGRKKAYARNVHQVWYRASYWAHSARGTARAGAPSTESRLISFPAGDCGVGSQNPTRGSSCNPHAVS